MLLVHTCAAQYNENQPRVCRLRKFGRRWLKAVQESSRTKAPLLRTRSAGTLGLAGPPHIDCSQATLLPTLRPDGTMHEHLQVGPRVCQAASCQRCMHTPTTRSRAPLPPAAPGARA